MLIKRDLFTRLEKERYAKKITALVGSRQVGKTTILKQLYEMTADAQFITFEDTEILNLFNMNIKLFVEQYVVPNKVLFIDEFQYAREGGKQLKYIYDTQKTKLFITGSSHPELTIRSLQFLVGRVNIIEMYPVSFKEFIAYKSKSKAVLLRKVRKLADLAQLHDLFEEYLLYGGYPAIITSEDKQADLKQLVQTYLYKEIRDVLMYKNSFAFEQVMQLVALQDAKILKKTNISLNTDINRNKVNEILNVLEKTYVLALVRPFLKNKRKEVIRSSKAIFQDLGMKNSITKNFNPLYLRSDKGEVYESFIGNELKRGGRELRFWNLNNRYEMDFVVVAGEKITGIEVKSKLLNSKPTKSMRKFIELFRPEQVIVFNENIDGEYSLEGTNVLFTSHLNVSALLELEAV
ncbi:MAG: ATP-binding protein [DPANN group archaeon]|nr:ATP-binding protein [DPANN group archaeon]